MHQFISRQGPAQDLQPPTVGHHFQRAVIDDANDFRSEQDPQTRFQAALMAQCAEQLIGHGAVAWRNLVILHEVAQQAGVPLLLGDEQCEDFLERVIRLVRQYRCTASRNCAPSELSPS